MTARLTDPTLRRVAALDPAYDAFRDAADHPARAAGARLTVAEAARADALLARLEATPRGTASSEHRRRRLPGTIKTRLAAAGAAVLAVVGAMILVPSTASAEGVLLQAADAAALQPEATGAYWYVHWQAHVTDLGLSGKPRTVEFDREIWVGREGGILRDGFAAATDDNADELRNEALEGPTLFGDEAPFTWDELESLPTDPATLRAALEARIRDQETVEVSDYRVYHAAAALLTETPAPPQVRRALWQVLAAIPELTLDGETTDAMGRTGTAITADFSADRLGVNQWVIDPTTGTVLESRMFPESGAAPDTLTLVEQGPRDTAPAADPPLCGPGSVPLRSC